MRSAQRGASLLVIAVILIGVLGVVFALVALFRTSSDLASSTQTTANFATAHRALEQFASATGRLPCPANGTLSTGDADPPGASANCNSPNGTLPWRTIGMRWEEALDAWGRKISYRVYTGNNGSLTQADGVSMVKCECDLACEPNPGARTPLVGNAGGLCSTSSNPYTYNVTEATFLAGKGLAVNDFGTNVTDAGYVLVSHGPSGLGGYTSSGSATGAPGSAAKVNNMQPAGPFTAQAPVTAGLAPTDPNYFDDVVSYQRLRDFIRRANLSARDWPEFNFASLRMDTATLTAALGQAPGADTGQQTITFPNATVTGFNSGGNQNISFGASGATEGIGVVGAAAGLGSTTGDGLRIDLPKKARQFAVTLDDFGSNFVSFFGFPFPDFERAQFTFFNGASSVATVQKLACHADGPGQLASFSIDLGATDFDRVEIRPLGTFPFNNTTSFLVSAFGSCGASPPACLTSLDTGPAPGGNRCP